MDVYPPNVVSTFAVPLDHFRYDDESSRSFDLRYMAYTAFVDPSSTVPPPVFLYLGNEGSIESFYNASGGLFDMGR